MNSKYYTVFLSNGDDDSVFTICLSDSDALYEKLWIIAESEMLNRGYKRPWFITAVKPKRGGYRPGAGRKPEGKGPKTMPRRVPTEWADKISEIDALLARISDWRDRAAEASETSPRWERMREFLKEVDDLGI